MNEEEIFFAKGDRIVGTGMTDGVDITGLVGTVVDVQTDSVGVRFDEKYTGFHTLAGKVEFGHGYWCEKDTIQHLVDTPAVEFDAPSVMDLYG